MIRRRFDGADAQIVDIRGQRRLVQNGVGRAIRAFFEWNAEMGPVLGARLEPPRIEPRPVF